MPRLMMMMDLSMEVDSDRSNNISYVEAVGFLG